MRKFFEAVQSITQRWLSERPRPSAAPRGRHPKNRLQRIEQLEQRTLLSISGGMEVLSIDDAWAQFPEIRGNDVRVGVIANGTEATAMVNVIQSVAPSAIVRTPEGATDEAGFRAAVNKLQDPNGDGNDSDGVDVIVAAPGIYYLPWFEDGIAAQAVQNVIEGTDAVDGSGSYDPIVFINAAGDDGDAIHYQHAFVPFNLGSSGVHDFDPSSSSNDLFVFDVAANEVADVYLQWNDTWGGTDLDTDFDLYLYKWDNGWVQVDASEDRQGTNGFRNPWEHVSNTASPVAQTLAIRINYSNWEWYSTPSNTLEIVVAGQVSGASNAHGGYATNDISDAIFGPSALSSSITVGTASYDSSPFAVANYSSRGPSTILLGANQGTRLSLDGIAVDNVDTGYVGTSIAAAYTAGIAALMLDMDPGLTPTEIHASLVDTAQWTSTVDPMPDYDNVRGNGLFDAVAAMLDANPLDSPQLASGSDRGVPNDNLTNTATDGSLTFSGIVSDTYAGQILQLYVDGDADASITLGAATGSGISYTVLATSSALNATGTHTHNVAIRVAPTLGEIPDAVQSPSLWITVDNVVPIITGVDPWPDGRTISPPNAQVSVTFSEQVYGVDTTDIVLSGPATDGGASVTAVTDQGANTWQFSGAGLVGGPLYLAVAPDANDIQDLAGNDVAVQVGLYSVEADFGDVPSAYPVTAAENGARHNATGATLGLTRDAETNGVHSDLADADGTDQDGVAVSGPNFYVSTTMDNPVTVELTMGSATSGTYNYLNAWIDYNRDGDWNDAGEQIADGEPLGDASFADVPYTIDIPQDTGANVDLGPTYVRLRLSSTPDLNPTGPAFDGEVEDYVVVLAAAPTVQFSSANFQDEETAGTSNAITLTRTGDTSVETQVEVTVTGGTATVADYTFTSLPVTFAADETTKTIALPILDDTLVEGNENITFEVTGIQNASIGTQSTTTFGILDNDVDLAITADMYEDLRVPLGELGEGERFEGHSGTTNFTFTVTRTGDLRETTTVNWALAHGTTDDDDFGGISPTGGTLTFDPDVATQTITVQVSGDAVDEFDETFTISLENPSSPALIATGEATGTILTDDVNLDVLEVSTLADGDDGIYSPGYLSLREALKFAKETEWPDLVYFDEAIAELELEARKITLTDGQMVIDSDVNIQGLDGLTIDAANNSRILRVESGAVVTIADMVFTRGNSDTGGALYVFDSTVALANVEITHSVAKYGGGMFVGYGATATLDGDTVLSDNTAAGSPVSNGGGLYIYGAGSTVTLLDNATIQNNSAAYAGGGVSVVSGAVLDHLGSVVVANNSAPRYSNIYAEGATTLVNATLVVSTVDDESDGIYSTGDLSLREAVLLANSYGGTNSITFDPTFVAPTLTLNLGELVIENSVKIEGLTTTDVTIDAANKSRIFRIIGGAVDVSNLVLTRSAADTGGAIYTTGSSSLSLMNVAITFSTAKYGGGMFVGRGATATLDGDTVLSNNTAAGSPVSNGGGLYIYGAGSTVTLLDNATIQNNSAAYAGGGVSVVSGAVLDHLGSVVVVNNSAPRYSNIYAEGATTLVNATLVVSTVDDESDGIYSTGDLSLREAVLLANSYGGTNSITFDPTFIAPTLTLNLGELVIENNVKIEGLTTTDVTIDAANKSRIFRIIGGAVDVSNLVLTRGAADTGGAIYTMGSSSLSLMNVAITFSTAKYGGGMFVGYGATAALVGDTVLSNNTAAGSPVSNGGGLYIYGAGSSVTLLDNATIQNNSAAYAGGGVSVQNSANLIVSGASRIIANVAPIDPDVYD